MLKCRCPRSRRHMKLQSRPFFAAMFLSLAATTPLLAQTLSAEQQQAWRSQIRSTLFVPEPLPTLNTQIHGSFEPAEGIIAERVTYETQFGLRVPAILYRPKKHTGKLPALIVV